MHPHLSLMKGSTRLAADPVTWLPKEQTPCNTKDQQPTEK